MYSCRKRTASSLLTNLDNLFIEVRWWVSAECCENWSNNRHNTDVIVRNFCSLPPVWQRLFGITAVNHKLIYYFRSIKSSCFGKFLIFLRVRKDKTFTSRLKNVAPVQVVLEWKIDVLSREFIKQIYLDGLCLFLKFLHGIKILRITWMTFRSYSNY